MNKQKDMVTKLHGCAIIKRLAAHGLDYKGEKLLWQCKGMDLS